MGRRGIPKGRGLNILLCSEQPANARNNGRDAITRVHATQQLHANGPLYRTLMAGVHEPPEPLQAISNGNLMEIVNYRNRSTGAEIYYCVDCWQGLRLENNAQCGTKMKYLLHSYSPSSLFFFKLFFLGGEITKPQNFKTNQFALAFLEILLNNSL